MKAEKTDWFIIHTKPKQEFFTEKHLKAQGITAYLPVYLKKKIKKRERAEVLTPLFSGYLFARFDVQRHYHKVKYTKGVKAILGQRQMPLDHRRRQDPGHPVTRTERRRDHAPAAGAIPEGRPIVIDEGEFEGWEGIFQEELPDRERAIILLTNVQLFQHADPAQEVPGRSISDRSANAMRRSYQ